MPATVVEALQLKKVMTLKFMSVASVFLNWNENQVLWSC
ncbi:MAG: hypothetical protein WCG16_05620 [Methylococcales bacterium]